MDVVPALQLYQNKPEGVLAVCDNCTGFLETSHLKIFLVCLAGHQLLA